MAYNEPPTDHPARPPDGRTDPSAERDVRRGRHRARHADAAPDAYDEDTYGYAYGDGVSAHPMYGRDPSLPDDGRGPSHAADDARRDGRGPAGDRWMGTPPSAARPPVSPPPVSPPPGTGPGWDPRRGPGTPPAGRGAGAPYAGPVRPVGTMIVEPLGESSSRMTLELDLEGHGLGKLFAIVARRQAAKQVPESHKKFKELLEHGAAAASS